MKIAAWIPWVIDLADLNVQSVATLAIGIEGAGAAGMLLIDDIHFINGKEQTEECFFHTFNELHNTNRQIVITSNYPPKSMPQLEERLRSRFGWGLIADIQQPDLETRLAILRAKSEEAGANAAPDVLELIARHIQHNIRELEGGLNRVVAYARLLRSLLTPELAAKALENGTIDSFSTSSSSAKPSISNLLKAPGSKPA